VKNIGKKKREGNGKMNVITTSYFKSLAPVGAKVCIAKKAPRGFRGHHFLELAPSHPWARDWRGSYRKDLETRFPGGEGLRELLDRIAKLVPEPVLCCYESDPGECHRRILADYIEEHLGITITEWTESN